jgi:hypothetical protein
MFTKPGIHWQTSPKPQNMELYKKTHYAVLEFRNVNRMMDRQADRQTYRQAEKELKARKVDGAFLQSFFENSDVLQWT